jgi:hypothetical protein
MSALEIHDFVVRHADFSGDPKPHGLPEFAARRFTIEIELLPIIAAASVSAAYVGSQFIEHGFLALDLGQRFPGPATDKSRRLCNIGFLRKAVLSRKHPPSSRDTLHNCKFHAVMQITPECEEM